MRLKKQDTFPSPSSGHLPATGHDANYLPERLKSFWRAGGRGGRSGRSHRWRLSCRIRPRNRWKIENEGFNVQKNSGLNMEHGYSTDPDLMRAYYVLLQIAHMILQLVEKGSPLKHLARLSGKTPDRLWGGLANLARRFPDAFRYCRMPDATFDPVAASSCQIRVDSS